MYYHNDIITLKKRDNADMVANDDDNYTIAQKKKEGRGVLLLSLSSI